MAFEAGQIVGDYEILNSLGAGGMGQVYRARNVISQRVEAIKVLRQAMTAEPDFAARFSAEIRMLASFDHPNIAQLRTAFQAGGQQLMVMEFVEGSTLDELTRKRELGTGEVLAIAKQILAALSYAHGRGVIHRDIKPANVMVNERDAVKLMDFGIAKSAAETQLTQPGSTVGSLPYISPEQVRGLPVDARSDIYSVGILLYELLARRRPFQADATFKLLEQHLHETPPPPTTFNPKVPAALSDLVLMAIAKEPGQRFQSAEAFSRALNSIGGEATETRPAAPKAASTAAAPDAATRQPRSNRTLWVVAGGLVTIAVLMAALIVAPRFFHMGAAGPAQSETLKTPQTSQPAAAAPPVASGQDATGSAQKASAPPPQAIPEEKKASVPVTDSAHASTAEATRNERPRSATRKAVAAPQQTPATPLAAAEPAPPPPANPQAQTAAPADGAADAAALEAAQDEMVKLSARAGAVSASVERLQQQQAADGLGLRGDMAGAYARMQAYLHSVDADLAAGNAPAATRHMDLAEKEISTLETFFHKP